MKQSVGPVKGLAGGKVVLRGGPRDGELVNLPFLAKPGVVASGVHPEDIGTAATPRRVLYEILEDRHRRRQVAEYRGIEAADGAATQLPLLDGED
jgi:hypothetical protein